jgi:hypothetical protein
MTKKEYTKDEIKELFGQAKNGTLPKDFSRWELANVFDWTIAHTAAYEGHLPKDFGKENPELWRLANYHGVTVAHIAARGGYLPDDFDQWDIADNKGRTVLETFAEFNE